MLMQTHNEDLGTKHENINIQNVLIKGMARLHFY